jgi:hypothetical protein
MNMLTSPVLRVALMAVFLVVANGAVFAQGRSVGAYSPGAVRGHVSVVAFGGILDPQSPEVLPILQRLADRYASRGVEVYWVSIDPSQPGGSSSVSDADLAGYAAKNGFRGAVLRDPSRAGLRSVNTGRRVQLPTFVVLDSGGKVVGSPIPGFDREADLVNQIASTLDRVVGR